MKTQIGNHITILARTFEEAINQFKEENLADQGYVIDGPIVSRTFMTAGTPGANKGLFGGAPMFAVNFSRQS